MKRKKSRKRTFSCILVSVLLTLEGKRKEKKRKEKKRKEKKRKGLERYYVYCTGIRCKYTQRRTNHSMLDCLFLLLIFFILKG
jgi:hypothetical protein